MADNKHLNKAKYTKNDEFYTQLSDIEKELIHYKSQFKGKRIYCNCDKPRKSAFWEYFHTHFKELKLKRLTATFLTTEGDAFAAVYEGGKDLDLTYYSTIPLVSDGDFRSLDSQYFLKHSDIVVTNPPFSIFREFISLMKEFDKQFLVIGTFNMVKYNDIFTDIVDRKMWLGVFNGNMNFKVPATSEVRSNRYWEDSTGQKWRSLGNIIWLTNIKIPKCDEYIPLTKEYIPENYPKYDNIDAIEVSKVLNIPKDYFGKMCVPITFLARYNPEQFAILEDVRYGRLNGKKMYERLLIQRKDI